MKQPLAMQGSTEHTCRGGSLVEEGGVLLRPHNAGVPQRVYDGVVHNGVRLASLALHRLECLCCMDPSQLVPTQNMLKSYTCT